MTDCKMTDEICKMLRVYYGNVVASTVTREQNILYRVRYRNCRK